jgi:hypothetical protein
MPNSKAIKKLRSQLTYTHPFNLQKIWLMKKSNATDHQRRTCARESYS